MDKELKWYYIQYGDRYTSSVDKIKLTDVSSDMLVVKKDTLDYGTNYTFFVECKY